MKTPLEIYRQAFKDPAYAHHHPSEFRYQWAIDMAHEYHPHSIVDIGSGRGRFCQRIVKEVPSAHIVSCDLDKFHDISVPHIILNLNQPNDRLLLSRLRVDMVACLDVLEHFQEHDAVALLHVIATCAPRCALTIANHREQFRGHELHLTLQDKNWWSDKLTHHFQIIRAETKYNGRLYAFWCVNRNVNAK